MRSAQTLLEGHVLDRADPDRRFVVDLLLNDRPFAVARAELFDETLWAAGIGDGCHGFVFHLDPAVLPALRTASLRIANTQDAVGETIAFEPAVLSPSVLPLGAVEWTGGLCLAGWLEADPALDPPVVEAWSDGALIALARADRWRTVRHGAAERLCRGFELLLPPALADGRAKRIEVTSGNRPLAGSPATVIAFEDGLADFLAARAETDAEQPRGRFFDAAFPGHLPFSALAEYERRFPLPAPPVAPARPVLVAVIGGDGADAVLEGPVLADTADWIGAVLPSRDETTGFDPGDLAALLEGEGKACACVVFLPAGAAPRPFGIDRLAAALEADPAAEIAYGDVLLATAGGTLFPLALPAFDYERILEQGLGARAFAMRRSSALKAAQRGIAELHRLFLAPLDAGGLYRATHLHVPGFGLVLPAPDPADESLRAATAAHLEERGVVAEIAPRPRAVLPALRIRRKSEPRKLTLLLEAGERPDLIRPALAALEATRTGRALDLVISAPPLDEDLARELSLAAIDHAESPRHLSPARRLRQGVERASGDLVCVFDARLRPLDAAWLDELLSRAAEPDMGAVAPVLTHANGFLAQAGHVLQPTGEPVPAFCDRRHGDPGYGDALLVARQVAVIGPFCFLTRRADFLALGGFDPVLFPDHFGAADYALKLQALGRRVVVTPDAVLRFADGEGPDDGPLAPFVERARRRERLRLQARWAAIAARDPFHNPLLARGTEPFAGLAWPPGDLSPRRAAVPPAADPPPGW